MLLCLCLIQPPPAYADETIQLIIKGVYGKELENTQKSIPVPKNLIKEGSVDRLWLERYKRQIPKKVREALEPFGYFNPQVKITTEQPVANLFHIIVSIDPGKPVVITKIEVKLTGDGSRNPDLTKLINSFPLRKGDILRQDIYEAAKSELKTRAFSLGYLGADFAVHEITVDPETHVAQVNLTFDTGPLYYFGDITITGAPQYPDSFLRRYLEFHTGDVFSYDKIGKTQRNFINADRFQQAFISSSKDDAIDYRVPITIKLTPSEPKRLKLGVGYGTDTGARFSANYQDVNVFHTSNRFETELNVSERLQVLTSRYVIPDHRDIATFTSLSIQGKREYTSDIDSKSVVFEIERARSFGAGNTGSAFLQFMKEDSTAGDDRTDAFLVIPGIRYNSIHYQTIIRPFKGYRYGFELKGTHQYIGSSTGFIQFIPSGDLIYPLPARLAIITRAKIGTTLQNEPARNLPIALRFFAGGDQSVRGYAYKSLGPTDDNGDVIGGKNLFAGSIELERAIGENWGIAVFYDTGNAFNDIPNMDLAQGAGIGGRYYTKIGPIKVDLARQIGVSDPKYRIHFSIGFGL